MRHLLYSAVLAAMLSAAPAQSQTAPAVSKNEDAVVSTLRQFPLASFKIESRALYLLDIEHGSTTLITDQPAPDLAYCGTPSWSADGRRIFFDATPGKEWDKTHLLMIDTGGGSSLLKDLGVGNCPNLSPDGKSIAFLFNHNPMGVWLMNADGTNRRQLPGREEYGIPKWSPDGRLILLTDFGKPPGSRIINLEHPENPTGQDIQVADQELVSVPQWAGDDQTLISFVKSNGVISIALIDIINPPAAKVKQTLWRKAEGVTFKVYYPVYSKTTGQCIFVGRNGANTSLYSFRTGAPAAPQRIDAAGDYESIVNLAFSPDGRFLLYCAEPLARP